MAYDFCQIGTNKLEHLYSTGLIPEENIIYYGV